jgi:hypothetical protein
MRKEFNIITRYGKKHEFVPYEEIKDLKVIEHPCNNCSLNKNHCGNILTCISRNRIDHKDGIFRKIK